jgi:Ran GTPase-activating protein (RanGAP) involved in mRNA processing and transport
MVSASSVTVPTMEWFAHSKRKTSARAMDVVMDDEMAQRHNKLMVWNARQRAVVARFAERSTAERILAATICSPVRTRTRPRQPSTAPAVLQGGGLDADTRTWDEGDDEEERRARIDLVAEMDAAAEGPLQADRSPEIKRELFKAVPPPRRPTIGPERPDTCRDDGDDTTLDDIDDRQPHSSGEHEPVPKSHQPATRPMGPKEGDYVRFKHTRVETTGIVIKRSETRIRVQPKDGGLTLWKELSELLPLASPVFEVSEALGPVRPDACDDGDDTNLDDIDDVDDAVAVAAQSAQAAVEAEAEAEEAEAAEERLTGMVRVRGGGCAASKPRAQAKRFIQDLDVPPRSPSLAVEQGAEAAPEDAKVVEPPPRLPPSPVVARRRTPLLDTEYVTEYLPPPQDAISPPRREPPSPDVNERRRRTPLLEPVPETTDSAPTEVVEPAAGAAMEAEPAPAEASAETRNPIVEIGSFIIDAIVQAFTPRETPVQANPINDADDTNLDDIDDDNDNAVRSTVTIGAPSEEMIRVLSRLDDRLADALRTGDIKLLRVSWLRRLRGLLRQPDWRSLRRRQELEALRAESPFLSAEEAVALLRRGNRGVGALTHGWLSPGECDPDGARLEMVLAALDEHPHIEGVFWDYASLFQNLPDRDRTPDERAAFGRAITVMADVYASAVGTTVLQSREIPRRPKAFDGALCLFGLKHTTGEAAVRKTLGCFGTIIAFEPTRNPPVVRFTSHEAALAAKRAGPWPELCDGVDTLYNERPYDERGWCVFENAVSYELLARLRTVPRVREALDALPSKVLVLRSGLPTKPGVAPTGQLETRVAEVVSSIERATFTGKGDKDTVPALYRDYVARIVGVVQSVLATSGSGTAAPVELPPLPQVDAPAASPLRLAEGQPLLLLSWQGNGAGGGPRFGVVDATGGRVAAAVMGGDDAELAYDRCSQAVLPWRPPAAGWDAAFVGDARALRNLVEPARRLAEDARRMESESALRAVGERAREIAEGAARCQSIAHAAREAGSAVRSCVDAAAKLFKAQQQGDPTQLQAALGKVRAAVERLQPVALEAALTAALRSSGALGARRYAAGQPLTVRTAGGWRDANVASTGADGLRHGLSFLEGSSGEPPATLTLHPWNHAPRELPHAAFEALSRWLTRKLRKQHSQIFDALSGKRLDALQQCVAIEVMGDADLAGVHDVRGLSDWLHSLHAARRLGEAITAPGAALLTAPPAAGKTTLISQAVVLALDRAELVPIVIKVQLLQARLRDAPDAFASHWNWVDAYLSLTERPEVHRMLRQAMMARRALLLLDGLDEAGAKRAEIEQHIVEVLAPQGHVMLCTSRPAGVVEARFAGFCLLKLAPLTEAQQEQALLQRLGNEGDVRQLMTFVERMPTSTDPDAPTMQHRVTANPLMLSMVASVFEIRKGLGMPKTVAELYASASDAMLARGGVVTAKVRTLLEVVFFEAHVAQARVITDVQLLRAALSAFAPPGTLANLDAKVANPFQTFKGRPEEGHYVELLDCAWKGQRGVIVKDDKSYSPYRSPYNVKLSDGATTGWLYAKQLASSGLDEAACRVQMARVDAERLHALDGAVQALRDEERAAVAQVRERVGQDRLPLLSLLQVEPLQMQSAHLSFQEYFAARAICSGKYRLPEGSPPPWQWPAFWANAVTLGSEMGDAFGKGLKQTAGVDDELDLSEKLTGGDRPTMVAAVAQLMRGLVSLSLRENKLTDGEGVKMVEALQANTTLTQLSLNSNKLGDAGGCALAVVLKANTTLRQLDLGGNELGVESGKAMVEALKANTTFCTVTLDGSVLSIAELTLLKNRFDVETATMLAKIGAERGIMLSGMKRDQTEADFSSRGLSSRGLQPADAILIGSDLQFMAVLKNCNLLMNRFDVESATMLAKIGAERGIMLSGMTRDQSSAHFWGRHLQPADAILIASDLKFMAVLTELDLTRNNIGPEGAVAISEALKVNVVLTKLVLAYNSIGDNGAKAIAEALKVNAVVTTLDLDDNNISPEGAIAIIAEALKVNAVLTKLHLYGNSIGPEGAIAIAEALQVNAVLTELDLGYNYIGVDCAKAIAEALKVNAVMTTLNLRGNNIGDEGAIAIAEALKVNAVLTTLVLSSNNIGPEGAIAIAEALKVNAVLTTLDLSQNYNISDDGAKAIAEALKVNAVLTKLDLRYIRDMGDAGNMGDAGEKAVRDAVKDRSGFVLYFQ